MEKIFYTVEEVQKVLSIGRNKAYQYCEDGTIPTIRLESNGVPIKALHEQYDIQR